MELNDQQYQRVARYLDGEPVQLDGAEQTAADEIRQAGQMLAPMLAATPPEGAVDHAGRRLAAALAGRNWAVRLIRPVAAAAAILLLAAAAFLIPGQPKPSSMAEGLPADLVADVYSQTEQNIDLDLVKAELDELAAEIFVSLPAGRVEVELDALQQNLDTFWLEEADQWPDEI